MMYIAYSPISTKFRNRAEWATSDAAQPEDHSTSLDQGQRIKPIIISMVLFSFYIGPSGDTAATPSPQENIG